MTPTTNQLIIALMSARSNPNQKDQLAHQKALLDPERYAIDYLTDIMDCSQHFTKGSILFNLVSPKIYGIPVTIEPKEKSQLPEWMWESVECPIEPLTDLLHQAMACSWIINHDKAVLLKRSAQSDMTLLGQACNAGLSYDVTRCFELGGHPLPKNWETYRAPDGTEVPNRANIKSRPSLGECFVHFHNGEYAFVSGESFRQVDLVRVESLVSTSQSQLGDMVRKNTKAKQPELNARQIAELAQKYA